MELKVIGSSSSGNCYVLENDKEALLIELGINFKFIKQALNFNLRKVVAAIVTHSHNDHCCAVKDALKAGIDVYATKGEFAAMGVLQENNGMGTMHHRAKLIEADSIFTAGSFKIWPFKIEHDTPDPVGFIIHHADCGSTLFLTDSFYTRQKFKNLNNIIIECNFSLDIIDRKVKEGGLHESLRNRILKSHMHLGTCKDVLRANDLKAVNNIVLIHLSDSNSDAALFQSEITKLTGKNVHVADSGVIIPFDKKPF